MDLYEILNIDDEMPLELMEMFQTATLEMLPKKSKDNYMEVYNDFKAWQNSHGIQNITSNVMLAYFQELGKKDYKPTSLWAFHFMLEATFRVYENADMDEFHQVKAFLKNKSRRYKCVKAEVFTEEQIRKFIDEASDVLWLDVKVVCIFGICGACRTDEFVKLVRLSDTKNTYNHSFTINGSFVPIVQRYIDLRPVNLEGRFFTNYRKGKCTSQFIGKNKFSGIPKRMAEFLNLKDPARYTGHAFRRNSATILANSGWRSMTCAKNFGRMDHCSFNFYLAKPE